MPRLICDEHEHHPETAVDLGPVLAGLWRRLARLWRRS